MRRSIARFFQRFPFFLRFLLPYWRFFQPKFTVGAVGIVFNAEGQLLLVEHVLHPIAPWGLPGGWINRNEYPAQTVVRELQEELSLKVIVQALVLMKLSYKGHIDFAYLCTYEGEIGPLSRELLDYAWVDVDKLPPLGPFHREAVQRAIQVMKGSPDGE